MNPLNFIGRISDRIFTVFMAILLAQAPIYMNQYTQVLRGAHQESETTYLELESKAAQYDQTVEAFLYELSQNDDKKVRDNAEVSLSTVSRYTAYNKALRSLEKSNLFTRPFVFLRHLDSRIRSALKFQPGFPISWEGVVYGLLGILLAMLITGRIGKMIQRKKAAPAKAEV